MHESYLRNLPISVLPASSLVPFSARRLLRPKVLWTNDLLNGNIDPFQFSACLPCHAEEALELASGSVQLKAERYGGPGLAGNGGGVRCGLVAGIQIKGTGPNPLAGVTTDYWHKHGACSIQDCIREAIWGEILNTALPYGAARAVSIVLTGSIFGIETEDWKYRDSAKRAILLRQAVVRPAHYMRSTFFAPADATLCSDEERTRSSLSQLPQTLFELLQNLNFSGKDSLALEIGLDEVFRRAAYQLAASRAKRILHGSLIASNFGLDGRWLDFGTVTSIQAFDRALVAPGSADFWTQETTILETIGDLSFYVAKYLGYCPKAKIFECGVPLARRFLSTLNSRTCIEFAKLTGIPEDGLIAADEPHLRALWHAQRKVISENLSEVYLYFGDNRHEMPVEDQSKSLNQILLHCGLSSNQFELEGRLSRTSIDSEVLFEIADAYWNLRKGLRNVFRLSESRGHLDLAIALRAIRANFPNLPLHRRNFDSMVNDISMDTINGGNRILEFSTFWANVYDDAGIVRLDPWFTDEHNFTIGEDLILRINGKDATAQEISILIDSAKVPEASKESLLRILSNSNITRQM